MAIDITNLVNSLGIKLPSGNTDQHVGGYSSNAGAKAAKPATGVQAFATNVIKSLGSIGSHVVSGVASDISHTVGNVANDVANASSFGKRNAIYNAQLTANDAARKQWHQQLANGKISKDRFNKLMADLTEHEKSTSQNLQDTPSVGKFVGDYAKLGGLGLTVASGGATAAPEVLGASVARVPVIGSKLASASEGLAESVGAGKTLAGKSALAVPGKLVRNAVVTQPALAAATAVPQDLKAGDFKGAATNAALLAAPGIIKGASKILPKVGQAANDALYGREAGPIKSFFGAKAVDEAAAKNPKLLPILKQAELFTQSQPAVQNGQKASSFFNNHLAETLGLDPKSTTVEEFAKRFSAYAKPAEQLEELKRAGKIDSKFVLTADYKSTVPKAIAKITPDFESLDGTAKATLAAQIAKEVAGGNPTAADAISNAIFKSNSLDEVRAALTGLDRLNTQKISGFTPPKGFTVTFGPKVQATLPKLSESTGELDAGKAESKLLGWIGSGLTKYGLSTQSNSAEMYSKYGSYLDEELQKIGFTARDVKAKLTDYTQNRRSGFGVLDERQLGTTAIKNALGVKDSATAQKVRSAIFKAYDRMTLGDLGAAGKIEHALYKLPGYGAYRRIQGIGRYELNPFFRLQSGVEAELLSQNVAKGKSLHLPGTNYLRQKFDAKTSDELLANADKVTQGLLGEGLTGANAADNSLGQITAKLTTTQKMSLGGLVKTLAEKQGKSVDDFLETADRATLDNIRSVVQYPREGFLSSNFAKTMNMMVFPSRYSLKLASIAGKTLADMPPLMQVSTLKGLSDFQNFLNSDEGIKWKSENSEALGILNYLNPFNNLGTIASKLSSGNIGIGDFGQIGGLPLGVITQLIGTQTGVTPNKAYLDPKTGEVVPNKVPANTAGMAKLAITDIINSMYSYPGRTFGANTSKNTLTQDVLSGGVLKPGKGETTNTTPTLTPNQQHVQDVLRSASAQPTSATSGLVPSKKATVYSPPKSLGASNFNAPPKSAPKPKKAKNKAFRPTAL